MKKAASAATAAAGGAGGATGTGACIVDPTVGLRF